MLSSAYARWGVSNVDVGLRAWVINGERIALADGRTPHADIPFSLPCTH